MPQSWMKRESERQEFVQEWKERFFREFEEKNFYPLANELGEENRLCLYSFLHAMFAASWIKKHQVPTPASQGGLLGPNWKVPPKVPEIYTTLQDSIKRFSRTPAERQYMIATFLTFFNEQICAFFCHELQKQQVMQPEKIYGGHSATDDVPLEDGE